MKMLRLEFLLAIAALGLQTGAEVIDPGTGQAVARGTVSGSDAVEVKSGIVTMNLASQYSGTLKASGGTVVMTALPETTEVKSKVVATASEPIPFEIRKPDDFDWLKVSPSSGVIGGANGVSEFSVTVDPGACTNRHYFRGAFLVRTTNGLSRVVSVNAEGDYVPPFYAHGENDFAQYADLDNPASGSALSGDATYEFTVTKATNYYFLVHCAATSLKTIKINAGVDGETLAWSSQQLKPYPTWTMITPGKSFGDYCRAYFLQPGTHTVRIQYDYSAFPYDGVVITDNPEPFEPR